MREIQWQRMKKKTRPRLSLLRKPSSLLLQRSFWLFCCFIVMNWLQAGLNHPLPVRHNHTERDPTTTTIQWLDVFSTSTKTVLQEIYSFCWICLIVIWYLLSTRDWSLHIYSFLLHWYKIKSECKKHKIESERPVNPAEAGLKLFQELPL